MSKKKAKPEKMDEDAIKNALRMDTNEDRNLLNKASALGEILPTIQGQNKVMTDEQLKALHRAFFPDDDKLYDSDDSIISEIDFMPDEEIQMKDEKMRACFRSIETMNEENERARMICKIGQETAKEREKRRALVAESSDGLTEKQRKEVAKKRKKEQRSMEKRLNTQVQVFTKAVEKKKTPYLTCSQFSSILEVMAEMVSMDEEEEEKEHRHKVKEIDEEELNKKLSSLGLNRNFYVGEKGRSVENYVKKKVKQVLNDENVQWVFNGDTFGFDFDARKSLLALDNYYSLKSAKGHDNGKSIDPLAIDIRQLLRSAYITERCENPAVHVNEHLKWALFESNH